MGVWLVRGGRSGEAENIALEQNVAVISWRELRDLSSVSSRDALESLYKKAYPKASPGKVANHVGQIWAFLSRMQVGDLVGLPLKTRKGIIAFGEIKGPYEYRDDLEIYARHTRPVEWKWKDVPRSKFDQDILHSLGAAMTVCKIERNGAEERIRDIIEGRKTAFAATQVPTVTEVQEPTDTQAPEIDIEERALDQIRGHIGTRFKSHELARLVDALLQAQGFKTLRSPPGPDGGVDILAGKGLMGFDPPGICVQVKSSDQPTDVKVLRELQGVMTAHKADKGLLICWGGFKKSVYDEAKRGYFQIRLWNADELVENLLENYEKLPEDIQAELPLKQIWSLVKEES